MRRISGLVAFVAILGIVDSAEAGSNRATEQIMQAGYDVGPGGMLRVDVPDADIEVLPGAGDRVEVEILLGAKDMEWARRHVDAMDLKIDGSGSEVTVTGKDPKMRFTWRRGDWFSLLVRVKAPEDFNVNLDSDDGDITVERLNGSLEIRTSDGDISLGRIDARDAAVSTSDGDVVIGELLGGEIRIKSSDGDIEARRIDGSRISIRTSDGDISIDEASGELEASTSDGDIELGVGVGRLGPTTLTSGDGDITIRAASGFGADLELSGEDVVLSGGSFEGKRKETRAAGRFNGGGALLRATTHDGTVQLEAR